MSGLDVAIMIEGQDGLNWTRWQRLAAAAEELGFAGLFRSDHFTNGSGPHKDALELWASLTWLAGHTSRIEFGPLVSPVSFRNPVVTAWTAAAVDDLSGGRLRLGLGAGWQQREHQNHGFELLDVDQRFVRYQEGLEVIRLLLQSDTQSSFSGSFYHLEDALLLPRPQRPGGPPIVIGGNGPKRTLPLTARFADEWNAVYLVPEKFAELSAHLDALLRDAGRAPNQVRRTLMTRVVVGRNDAEIQRRLGDASASDLRARGALVGTPSALVDQFGTLARFGVQRVMAQWLDQDDLDGLELLASDVLPHLAGH